MSAGERIHRSDKAVSVFVKYKYNEDRLEVFKSNKEPYPAITYPERQ